MAYSNSKLATYTNYELEVNSNAREPGPISKITIHHMAGVMSPESCMQALKGHDSSCNYAIGPDGEIGCLCREARRSWCSSNRANDMVAVTIEVSNSSTGDDWPVSKASYDALINLCVDICVRNSIPRLIFDESDHQRSTLTMHSWFTSTLCPGPYLKRRFSEIASTVNSRLNEVSTGTNTPYDDPQLSTVTSRLEIVSAELVPADYIELTPEPGVYSRVGSDNILNVMCSKESNVRMFATVDNTYPEFGSGIEVRKGKIGITSNTHLRVAAYNEVKKLVSISSGTYLRRWTQPNAEPIDTVEETMRKKRVLSKRPYLISNDGVVKNLTLYSLQKIGIRR